MNEVIKNISTMDEKIRLLIFLDELSKKIFDPELDIYAFIDSNLGGLTGESLKTFLSSNINTGRVEMVLKQIKELRENLDRLPKITLTAAQIPSENQMQNVKNEFADIDIPVIIEFKEDKDLVGGAVLEGNGYIFEHSFRDYFEKRRRSFLSDKTAGKEINHGF